MNEWHQIVKQAIVGTQNQAFILPPAPTAMAALWTQLTDLPQEKQLLTSSALLNQYQRVGKKLPRVSLTLPPPAEETLQPPPPMALELFQEILQLNELEPAQLNEQFFPYLLAIWLKGLRQGHYHAPFSILPQLLTQAKQHKELREAIQAVMGARGQWLVQQNQEWRYLQPLNITTWEEGSFASRHLFLQSLRQTAPHQARQLLADSWHQESAKERIELLQTLWINLNSEDEIFLQNCLEDRSRYVREIASQMLGSLPDSSYLSQALARIDQYIKMTKIKAKIELPNQYDQAWEKEGMIKKLPSDEWKKLGGERAFWLHQLLMRVHPRQLINHWQISLAHILTLLRKTDYEKFLINTLQKAVKLHQDAETALELMLVQKNRAEAIRQFNLYEQFLSTSQKNEFLKHFFQTHKEASCRNWRDLQELVQVIDYPLEEDIADLIIEYGCKPLFKNIPQGSYHVIYVFIALGKTLPISYCDRIQEMSTIVEAKQDFYLQSGITFLCQISHLREKLYQVLQLSKNPN